MNKKVLIGSIAAVVLVVAAAAAFFFLQPASEERASKTSFADAEKNSATAQPNGAVRVSNIGNFYTDKSTRECSYSNTSESGTNNSTFYFDNNRAYTVITSSLDDKETKFYSLYKDGVSYVWQDGSQTGTKLTQSADELKAQYEASMNAASQQQATEAQNAAKDIVITCKSWNADESKFTVPTNIKFTEINV